MKSAFKIVSILSIVSFWPCLFFLAKGCLSQYCIAIPLGLGFANFALESLALRRDFLNGNGGAARCGSLRWKTVLITFWNIGIFALFLGASPLLGRLCATNRNTAVFIYVVVALTVVALILSEKKSPQACALGPTDAIATARSYFARGHTARAIHVLEYALVEYPGHAVIAAELNSMKGKFA